MTRNQLMGLLIFVLYTFLIFYLLFFSEMEERGLMAKADYTYNLTPFREIYRYLLHGEQIGRRGVFLNLWGNIIAFVPLGFTLPVFSGRCRKYWYNTLGVAYLVSFAIEMFQLLFRAGSCDVDDIILNSLGGIAGYLLFILVQYFRSLSYERHRRLRGIGRMI